METTRIQHIYETEHEGIVYRDALYFDLDEWQALAPAQLAKLKADRHVDKIQKISTLKQELSPREANLTLEEKALREQNLESLIRSQFAKI